jgi:uncharacterized protein DUF5522
MIDRQSIVIPVWDGSDEAITMNEFVEGEDFYREGDFIVFTRLYHLKRGYCCGSRCRHCPYDPRWTSGGTTVASEDPLCDAQSEQKKETEANSTGDE